MQYRLGSSDSEQRRAIGLDPPQPKLKNTVITPTWRGAKRQKYLVVGLPTNGLNCRRYLEPRGGVSHDAGAPGRNAHFAGP